MRQITFHVFGRRVVEDILRPGLGHRVARRGCSKCCREQAESSVKGKADAFTEGWRKGLFLVRTSTAGKRSIAMGSFDGQSSSACPFIWIEGRPSVRNSRGI